MKNYNGEEIHRSWGIAVVGVCLVVTAVVLGLLMS